MTRYTELWPIITCFITTVKHTAVKKDDKYEYINALQKHGLGVWRLGSGQSAWRRYINITLARNALYNKVRSQEKEGKWFYVNNEINLILHITLGYAPAKQSKVEMKRKMPSTE